MSVPPSLRRRCPRPPFNDPPRHPLHLVDRLGLHLAGPPGDHVDAGGRGAPRAVRREHRRARADASATCRASASAFSAGGAPPRASARSARTCSSTRRLLLPFPYSRVARWINRVLHAARRCSAGCGSPGSHRPIVWTFLPTPLALDLIRQRRPAADDLLLHRRPGLELAGRPARSRRASRQLFREADLVFVTSEKLRRARRAVERARAPVSVRRQPGARSSARAASQRSRAGRRRARCRGRWSAMSAACTSGSTRT